MLISSIREFAGKFSNNPIWIMIPKSHQLLDSRLETFFKDHNVIVYDYEIPAGPVQLPFTELIFSAATSEALAESLDLLVWLDSNTIILNEPKEFSLIDEKKDLLFAPVHVKLIGSSIEKPIDDFWSLLFKKCLISENNLFTMRTHTDGYYIRPYFNAGCLVTRPKKRIFQLWKKFFLDYGYSTELLEFYKKGELYQIFIHQALLTCSVLSTFNKNRLQQLPFEYNYPIHLYESSVSEFKPKNLNNLITIRYEDVENLNLLENELGESFSSWLHKIQAVIYN